jgi:hypothetical protein
MAKGEQFVPVDAAWKQMNFTDLVYLFSPLGTNELKKLVYLFSPLGTNELKKILQYHVCFLSLF